MKLQKLQRLFSTMIFSIRKKSPEILLGVAIASAAASVVLAAVSSTKLKDTIKPEKEKIADIHRHAKDPSAIANNLVDTKENTKDLAKLYSKAGIKIVKLYSPSLLAFSVSVAAMIGSHNIMQGRNLALAATCATIKQSYDEYRNRTIKALGAEKEEKIFKDVSKEKIVDKDGKVVGEKEVVKNNSELYSILYGEGQRWYEQDAKLNLNRILSTQAYLNEILRAKGYLFLSEVYEELGFTSEFLGADRVRASHIVGWLYRPEDKTRDNYVSFGLEKPSKIGAKGTMLKEEVADQLKNNEPNFWLTFNCDGDILLGNNGPTIGSVALQER